MLECKLDTCAVLFEPKTVNQKYCRPEHRIESHTLARIRGEKAANSKGIHFAKLGGSKRLQRVARYLACGNPHTTRDIIRWCDVCAVSTIIEELRHNGFVINCKKISKHRYEYTMIDGFENLKRIPFWERS